jgi:hypothetical protein
VSDDWLTVSAIAILAACIVTIDHEAIGHGSACLAFGGHIKLLTSVYFDCAGSRASVAAFGPIGNLAGATLAWLALKLLPAAHPRLRLLLLLVMAMGFFWEAGYMLYSTTLGEGDYAIAARAAFGALAWPLRIAIFCAGIALYAVAIRATASAARPFANAGALLRLSWLAASVAAVVATAFYAPDRQAAMIQGALEIGAGSIPLLGRFRGSGPAGVTIGRSIGWVASAAVVYVAFVATLGHGLPWAAIS